MEVDLLIGGSPCQDLSIAKKEREGLSGERSGLFYQYVRLLKECKPKWFVLENVASMSKTARDTITKELGVEPVMIDASLVSAQSRKRLFWTNIPSVGLPADKGIKVKDILDPNAGSKYTSKTVVLSKELTGKTGFYAMGRSIGRRTDAEGKRKDGDSTLPYEPRLEIRTDEKTGTLTNVQKDNLVIQPPIVRRLTPLECERLQCLPDGYTVGISDTQRYKCLGNAFNAEVVAHILKKIPSGV
jgi:DNA (cytosine-5)-methyltransferase 3A